ncbi:MAG: hypothetical protein FWD60_13425 [Candidatus Azobacteroides sp.]|nr:hypothetical protein [Candidatus Azobacteroides sp.]
MKLNDRQFLKTKAIRGLCLFVLIFCYSLTYSQNAINILDLYHDSFPDNTARIITANAQIGDYAFHANIGGISFQAVATPAESLKNEAVSLDFANNGVVVQIGTKKFYPDLPVWQLIPIINFADSPYTVVVSQSGDTTNNKEAQCRFHPAFLDNLLGLRLFQADLLNLTDILWDLPIDGQRHYILAPSEQPFTPLRDSTVHRSIYEKLATGDEFTSFVLTDKDVNIVFDIDESGLKLTGHPYYYFTKTSVDTANVNGLRNQMVNYYNDIETNAKILLKNKYTEALNPRTHLNNLIEAVNKLKQEKVFNPYSVYSIEKSISAIDSLNNMTDDQIGIKFQIRDKYTESFKPYWTLLEKFNPLVYSAVDNTSQWAAFFRYVRQVNPENWTQFVRKVGNTALSDAPDVQTPTSSDLNYFRYFDQKEKK